MPFCPDCGQEFVAGVATCPDCGVPLSAAPAQSPEEPDQHLVDIYTTQDAEEAEVVLALLRANDIECSHHSEVPVDAMEAIRVYVREDDAEVARALIAAQGEPGDAE